MSGRPGGPDPRALRVGDREREQAAQALGEHYALGRLTDVEHGERLDAVWSARTRSDLDVLFHDLPVAGHGAPRSPAPAGPGVPTVLVWVLVVLGALLVVRHPFLLIAALVLVFVLVKRKRRRDRARHPAQHPGWTGPAGRPGPPTWS